MILPGAQDVCPTNRLICLLSYTKLPISSGPHLTWPSHRGSSQGTGARGLYRGQKRGGGVRGRAARTGRGNEVVGSTLTFEVSSSQLRVPRAPPTSLKAALVTSAASKGPGWGRRADGWAGGQAEGDWWAGAGRGDPHLLLPPWGVHCCAGGRLGGERRAKDRVGVLGILTP